MHYGPVVGRNIHWAGPSERPPPDTPTCGFDQAVCPPGKRVIICFNITSLANLPIRISLTRQCVVLKHLNWAASWENRLLTYAKTKTQISFAVAAKLISAFVFATRIVQSLFYLNPKSQDSNHLLWLYRPVCVGPGRKLRRPVFSQRGSIYFWRKSSYHPVLTLMRRRVLLHLSYREVIISIFCQNFLIMC